MAVPWNTGGPGPPAALHTPWLMGQGVRGPVSTMREAGPVCTAARQAEMGQPCPEISTVSQGRPRISGCFPRITSPHLSVQLMMQISALL